jgi:chemotaxis protein MotB
MGHRQTPQLRTSAHPSLSYAALIAILVHIAAIFFLWQKIRPFTEAATSAVAFSSVAVELTPMSDLPSNTTGNPDNTSVLELQSFHSAALERTQTLEQTLTRALSHQVETEVAHQQQLTSLETAQTQMRGTLATLTEEKVDLSAQLADERQRSLTLEQQLQEAQRLKERELAGMKGTYDRLVSALQSEISQKEIALHQAKERLTVTILDRVLFPSGQATLTSEGEQIIAKVATILAKVSDQRILIEGHTDDVPISAALSTRFPTNWELSTARATEVVKYLIAQGKLTAHQLSAVGRADTAPVASNISEEGRRLNRRIEIIVLPAENPSPRLS